MKKVALLVMAALLFTFYAPKAQAQPFADVPTDIFAFDAVAELAAKGIIEGYPDGTFKGDRAMTRYEMAMVVARILARIEAIKIPPPPAPPPAGVTPATLAALQRMVNEFRAELAAQGVRVTAVEEELAAIRSRLSNVKITGDVRVRYNQFNTPTPNPCPIAGCVPGIGVPGALLPSIQQRARLTFVGQATSNVRGTLRMTTSPTSVFSSQITWGTNFGLVGGPQFSQIRFDVVQLEYSGLLGANWTLGQQVYTQDPIGKSGLGLLFDPGNMSNIGVEPGLFATGKFGGFSWDAGVWRDTPDTDIWTGRVGFALLPGWTASVGAISQRRNSVAPGTAGWTANTSDTGWEANLMGNLLPGVGFGAAFANFNGITPPGAAGNGGGGAMVATTSSNAWTAWFNLDLGAMSGMSTFAPVLAVWYKNYGPSSGPLSGPIMSGAATEFFNSFVWNFTGWGAQFNFKMTPDLSGQVNYESGSCQIASAAQLCPANGTSVTELFAQASYALAARTSLAVNYRSQTVGTSNASQYRVQLTYSY